MSSLTGISRRIRIPYSMSFSWEATSCRLFGIDLINHSSNSQQVDKLTLQPLNGSSGSNVAHTPGNLSAADMQQKSVGLKTLKEITQWQSPKEIRSKQSSTSARSRIKVPTL